MQHFGLGLREWRIYVCVYSSHQLQEEMRETHSASILSRVYQYVIPQYLLFNLCSLLYGPDRRE